MRHRIPKPPPRRMKQYRVRAKPQSSSSLLPDVMTFYPGVIKGNRPKADKALEAAQSQGYEAWLEYRESETDEWKRVN